MSFSNGKMYSQILMFWKNYPDTDKSLNNGKMHSITSYSKQINPGQL